MSEDREYRVKRIEGFSFRNQVLQFLIRWKGYSSRHNSWEPEENLTGCYDKLARFRRKNRLGPSPLPVPPAGANFKHESLLDRSKWVYPEDLRRVVLGLMETRSGSSLGVVVAINDLFDKPATDSVVILTACHHFYAMLWLANEDMALIADGINLCQEPEVLGKIEKHLGISLRPLTVAKSFGVDQCATGAALAALELARAHSKQMAGSIKVLSFADQLVERVAKALGQWESKPTPGRVNIQSRINLLRCSKCQNWTTRKGKRALFGHEKTCKP